MMKIKMSSRLISLCILLILLNQCTAVALADLYMEPPFPDNIRTVDGSYIHLKFAVLSPADNPLTREIEVRPGTEIAVSSTVTGPVPQMPFPILMNVYLDLYNGSRVITSKSYVYVVKPMSGTPITESRNLSIPADIPGGNYVVMAHSEIILPGALKAILSQQNSEREPGSPGWIPFIPDRVGMTRSWNVKVIDNKPPVVLVHGWHGSSSDMSYIRSRLEKEGYKCYLFDYDNKADPRKSASVLATYIDTVKKDYYKNGDGKCDIVCHSMGAIVTRYYMEELGGAKNVRQWIGVAPVNHGAAVADLGAMYDYNPIAYLEYYPDFLSIIVIQVKRPNLNEPAFQQLVTDSDTITALNNNPIPQGIKYRVIVGGNYKDHPLFFYGMDKTWAMKRAIGGTHNKERYYYLTHYGDGVVANEQSRIYGAGIDCIDGADHNSILQDSRAVDYIIRYIKDPSRLSMNNYPIYDPDDKGYEAGLPNIIDLGRSNIKKFTICTNDSEINMSAPGTYADNPGSNGSIAPYQVTMADSMAQGSLNIPKTIFDPVQISGVREINGDGLIGTLKNCILTDPTGKSIDGYSLETSDVSVSDGLTTLNASLKTNLTKLQQDGFIKLYMQYEPGLDEEGSYYDAAVDNNYYINGFAGVLVVEKNNVMNKVYENTNGSPQMVSDGDILDAVITMRVSSEWVESHGGNGSIMIFRYDNGTAEPLDTKYVGMENGSMVFQGISPHGLSSFSLCSVTSLSMVAHQEAVEHPPFGIDVPFILPIAIFIISIFALIAQGLGTIILGMGFLIKNNLYRLKK